MPGMPYGMADLLARKYDIMQQQANAESLRASSIANLEGVRAKLLPGESAAQVNLLGSQVGKTNADTASTIEQTKFVGPLANSEIAFKRTAGRQNLAQASNLDADTSTRSQLNRLFSTDPDFRSRLFGGSEGGTGSGIFDNSARPYTGFRFGF